MVQAYVLSYLYCFYRFVTLGCMDGISMFYTIEEMKKLIGDEYLTYYDECIEDMLPFTNNEQVKKEPNHDNESI